MPAMRKTVFRPVRQPRHTTLMRVHMYLACYGNFHQARDAWTEIAPGRGLRNCKSCVSCSSRCPHGLDVAQRLDELRLLYC